MTTLPVPAEVSHVRVYLTNLSIVATDASDADTLPDWQPAVGSVTLAPLLNTGSVVTTSSGRGFVPLAKTFTLDASGSFEGWVLNSADADLSPSGWSYRVTVAITSPSATVIVGTFTPGAATTDANLLPLLPVSSANGGVVVIPAGIPEGGTTGQSLVKASNADFDVEWAPGGTGGVTSVDGQTGAVSLSSTYATKAEVGSTYATKAEVGSTYATKVELAAAGGGSTLAQIGAVTLPESPTAGQLVIALVDSDTVLPEGVRWDMGGAPAVGTYDELTCTFLWNGTAWLGSYGFAHVIPDVTAPTPGTVTASSITDTSFTLTSTGHADDRELHPRAHAWDTGSGSYGDWSLYSSIAVPGKTAGTSYTIRHKVRDLAGNEAESTPIVVTVTTTAASTDLTATWLDSALWEPVSASTADRTITVSSGTDSHVLVGVTNYGGTGFTINSCTAGGTAATELLNYTPTTTFGLAFYTAEVTPGSVDVVVSLTNSAFPRVFVWSLNHAPTVLDTGTASASGTNVTVDTVADNFVAAISASSSASVAWTGATERADYEAGSAADTIPTGSTATIKVTGYLATLAIVSLT